MFFVFLFLDLLILNIINGNERRRLLAKEANTRRSQKANNLAVRVYVYSRGTYYPQRCCRWQRRSSTDYTMLARSLSVAVTWCAGQRRKVEKVVGDRCFGARSGAFSRCVRADQIGRWCALAITLAFPTRITYTRYLTSIRDRARSRRDCHTGEIIIVDAPIW